MAVDNTMATPILQRPFEFGADLVVHSASKYIGGHSDLIGGIVVAREKGALSERLRAIQQHGGAIQAPFDCWLARRGLMTLPVRMYMHVENAHAVAEFLAGHRHIEKVYYPGLADHPGHDIATRQMRGCGAVLVALVIPPLVFRPDRRGLHDLVAGSATVPLQTAQVQK